MRAGTAAAAAFHNTRARCFHASDDDEPDLPARTRKPETIHAMPDAPLAQLQSSCPVRLGGAHSLASLHPSRATLAAFVSSHSQPQFPESAVASFYLFDAGLVVPHCKAWISASPHGTAAQALGRCSIHAAPRRTRSLDFRLHCPSAKRR